MAITTEWISGNICYDGFSIIRPS